MSAQAYTEDQLVDPPAIGRLTGLLSGQVTFNSSAASVISKS